jgi:hypothetical protein
MIDELSKFLSATDEVADFDPDSSVNDRTQPPLDGNHYAIIKKGQVGEGKGEWVDPRTGETIDYAGNWFKPKKGENGTYFMMYLKFLVQNAAGEPYTINAYPSTEVRNGKCEANDILRALGVANRRGLSHAAMVKLIGEHIDAGKQILVTTQIQVEHPELDNQGNEIMVDGYAKKKTLRRMQKDLTLPNGKIEMEPKVTVGRFVVDGYTTVKVVGYGTK